MSEMDPLIAAVIGKLPEAGAHFPVEHREAWLRMMATALDVAFPSSGAPMTRTNTAKPATTPAIGALGPRPTTPLTARQQPAPAKPKKRAKAKAKRTRAPKPLRSSHPVEVGFYIDKQGFARNETGERILPGDVNNTLYDQRGDAGDLGSIIWADNSRGVQGHRFDIAAA